MQRAFFCVCLHFPFLFRFFTLDDVLTLQSANKGILFHWTFICTGTAMFPHDRVDLSSQYHPFPLRESTP